MAETKRLIEIDCLRIVAFFATAEDIKRLMVWVKTDEFHDDDFFLRIAILNRNRLMERIWRIVNSYARTSERVQGNVKKKIIWHFLHIYSNGMKKKPSKRILLELEICRRTSDTFLHDTTLISDIVCTKYQIIDNWW